MFYSSKYGAASIGVLTSYGSIDILKHLTLTTGFSHFVPLQGGKLLAYHKNSGGAWVAHVDLFANFRILNSTNIGSGWDEITSLGKQEKKKDGVCCYALGTGFMAYKRDKKRLKIFVVKSNNKVDGRRKYSTDGYNFDKITQLQGNKFIAYDRSRNRAYIGLISTLGYWYWDRIYYTDAGYYDQIFTMRFN
jgi:hypothetical protein